MKSPVVKRSIVVAGHKTSVSLEEAFWNGMKEISGLRNMTLSELVGEIDSNRQQGNLSSAIRLFVLDYFAGPEIIKHEQTNRRGQVALLAVAVDLADQFGQRHVTEAGDFLHAVPERLFKADAGLVAGDHDRSLHDGRFHDASSPSRRCWFKCSRARSDLVRPKRARLVSACFEIG